MIKQSFIPEPYDVVFTKDYGTPAQHQKYAPAYRFGSVALILEFNLRACAEEVQQAIETILDAYVAREDAKLGNYHAALCRQHPEEYTEDGLPKPDPAYAINEEEESARRAYWHGKGTAY